jgi:hypothetical protein
MTMVVSGSFTYCGVPPLTETETLRAVAGTYAGRLVTDETDPVFQFIVNVTGTEGDAEPPLPVGGVIDDPPPPPPPQAVSAPMRAIAARRRVFMQFPFQARRKGKRRANRV